MRHYQIDMNKQFKIWSAKKKQWEDPCRFALIGDGNILEFDNDGNSYNWKEPLSPYEIQQWTGLTDSTGAKIFEGDIVDYRYDGMNEFEKERMKDLLVSPVYWEEDRWRIKYSAAGYAWHIMKVIGNIYETPELLK